MTDLKNSSPEEKKKNNPAKEMDDVLHEVVGTTKSTFEVLKRWGADVIAVYFFVYYTAKRQKTNKAKATVSFIAKGLCITENRVRKANPAKKLLKKIQPHQRRGKKR